MPHLPAPLIFPIPKTAKNPDTPYHTAMPAPEDRQEADNIEGLLMPLSWPDSIAADGVAVCKYYYYLLATDKRNCGTALPVSGKFVIHVPSLAGILAHAILASTPDTRGFLLDKAWAGSNLRLSWFALRLQYERLRLGSDVESPYLRKLIHREKLQKILPRLTISQWLTAIDKMRRLSFPDGDFILWHNKAYPAATAAWLAARLHICK